MADSPPRSCCSGPRRPHVVEIPPELLEPAGGGGDAAPSTVVLRPLVLADVQRIQRAARDERALTSVLMVQQALVEPKLTVEQVQPHARGPGRVPARARSTGSAACRSAATSCDEAVQAPLARACFVLAREFGWTPDECAALTVGQVLLYLELLGSGDPAGMHER